MLSHDGNFDWTHKAYHTNQWVILAARHLFDDMFLAADALDLAIQLNFVFETGFTNLQFMAMAALADRAHHHLFEKTLASIQTDEARHAQIGHPVMRTLLDNGSRQRAQYLVDKMWWRCWRLFLALTGTAMEYLTPLGARTRSFKEFMTEWVTEQFMKNLAEFDLEKPWFWDLFVEELDYAHHSFQLGLYTYRTTLVVRRRARQARLNVMAERQIPALERRLRADCGISWKGAGRLRVRRTRFPTVCRRCATSASSRPCSSGPVATPPAHSRWMAGDICSARNHAVGFSSRSHNVSPATKAWWTGSSPERRPASSSICRSGWA